MKSVVSIALSLAMAGPALPVWAQGTVGPTPGPLARALAREATRLSVEPPPAAARPPQSEPPSSDWSVVRRLRPGTEIVLTLRGSAAGTRYVALVDRTGLDVLNVAMLPAPSGRAVIATAKDYPFFVTDARRGGVAAGDVRLGPSGVVINGAKVAELDQVLERIQQADVQELRVERAPAWPASRIAMVAAGVAVAVIGVAVLIDAIRLSNASAEEYRRAVAAASAGNHSCHCSLPESFGHRTAFGALALGGGTIVAVTGIGTRPSLGTIYRAQ